MDEWMDGWIKNEVGSESRRETSGSLDNRRTI